ncbi:MAG: hypothetical protein KatS3mg124_1970 [Porticoccaceae bacterium]|nr:MAG: hypothetical protein KatS3mg124_1970 [Porticoccaceae bacterium]
MDAILALEGYRWDLSLLALAAVLLVPKLLAPLFRLLPPFREVARLNREREQKQWAKSYYKPVQKRSAFWGMATQLAIFALIIPFVITAEPQPWWRVVRDMVLILMVYDFFYYLTHRFLFHDGGFGPGPLVWVHSVHHQQKDPCRRDASYLHPIEVSMGLGLYGLTIGLLGALLGDFHLVTIVVTWLAFSEINLINHDLMPADKFNRFPWNYLKYASHMHHVHHSSFASGNYATISLLYDWLFGTYDRGDGWGKNRRAQPKNA